MKAEWRQKGWSLGIKERIALTIRIRTTGIGVLFFLGRWKLDGLEKTNGLGIENTALGALPCYFIGLLVEGRRLAVKIWKWPTT